MLLAFLLAMGMLYIFETHPTQCHPTWRNDELTRCTWNQCGVAQVIKYDIYVVRRRGRLASRQPLSVCALLPA